MGSNVVERIASLFFRYLWFVCGAMVFVNFASTAYSSFHIVKNSADKSVAAVGKEISNKIDTSYSLLESLVNMPIFEDISIPIQDRAIYLRPFAANFNIWMMGVADPDGHVSGTLAYEAPKVKREYITAVTRTGKKHMTDLFPSGITGELNYTLVVPVKQNGRVVSMVFAALALRELNDIVIKNSREQDGYYFFLADERQVIIAHPKLQWHFRKMFDHNNMEIMIYNGKNVEKNMTQKRPGTYMSIWDERLYYTVYQNVPETPWTIVHRVRVFKAIEGPLIAFLMQSVTYISIFLIIYASGRKYLNQNLQPVDAIVQQVMDINRTITDKDEMSREELERVLSISKGGLKDELTKLPTRMFFREHLLMRIKKRPPGIGAVYFIDMDNLKAINDNFGHEYGDRALRFFGSILINLAKEHGGLCARYGGDEFVMYVDGLKDAGCAVAIAETVKDKLCGAIDRNGEKYSFGSSVGVALYPVHSDDIDTVITLADKALYAAKQKGKHCYMVYGETCAECT